jgi:hypothetical protein
MEKYNKYIINKNEYNFRIFFNDANYNTQQSLKGYLRMVYKTNNQQILNDVFEELNNLFIL